MVAGYGRWVFVVAAVTTRVWLSHPVPSEALRPGSFALNSERLNKVFILLRKFKIVPFRRHVQLIPLILTLLGGSNAHRKTKRLQTRVSRTRSTVVWKKLPRFDGA
jgi:hypothetical protein